MVNTKGGRKGPITLWPNLGKVPAKQAVLSARNMSDQVRAIRRIGKSVVVTLPPDVLSRSGLKPGDYVTFGFDKEGVIILGRIFSPGRR